MKHLLFFALLFSLTKTNGQGFTTSPYQNLTLHNPIVADFTGDKKPDVLGFMYGSNSRVFMMVNDGATPIAFTEKDLGLNFLVYGLAAAADMDGDLDMDVVVAKNGAGIELFILKNDGIGNFAVDSLGVSGGILFKVADFDKDLDMDIAGIDPATGILNLFVNDGAQHFTKKVILASSSKMKVFDIGDLDNDGDVDIVVGYDQFSGEQVVLFTNDGSNTFLKTVLNSDQFGLSDIRIDDIDTDGKKDILYTRSTDCDALLNQGGLVFSKKNLISTPNLLRTLLIGDYNGDGRHDIVLGANSEDITWHKNLSNATLQFESQTVGSVTPAFSISNGDLDSDNDMDIVVSNGEFWWYENGIPQTPSATNTAAQRSVAVFPNPFRDIVHIKNLENGHYEASISDSHGIKCLSAKLENDVLNLAGLPQGMYFLQLTDTKNGQATSIRLFKQE